MRTTPELKLGSQWLEQAHCEINHVSTGGAGRPLPVAQIGPLSASL